MENSATVMPEERILEDLPAAWTPTYRTPTRMEMTLMTTRSSMRVTPRRGAERGMPDEHGPRFWRFLSALAPTLPLPPP